MRAAAATAAVPASLHRGAPADARSSAGRRRGVPAGCCVARVGSHLVWQMNRAFPRMPRRSSDGDLNEGDALTTAATQRRA